ncbi:MAG: DegV family protein [Ruminococcaceae bacterium]|nr:DegV family protein [Oscillospiraceae bacterium]
MKMNKFIIYADSACDIDNEILAGWGVKRCELSLMFSDSEKEYLNNEINPVDFYNEMRAGKTAKTSAVNTQTFMDVFEEELKAGNDVVYVAFSSGLSTTYNSGVAAAAELMEKYPERKVLVVDTLAASAGYGMLVYLAAREQQKGATPEKIVEFVENIRLKIAHWFTVADLVYLKRGGRVSPTVAFVGGVLGIKPILHVDNEGHLISMSKVRGRRAAIAELANKFGETADKGAVQTVYISHGDCIDDANTLADILKKDYGVNVEITTFVGPVIGAHSGPGTLALFFIANER